MSLPALGCFWTKQFGQFLIKPDSVLKKTIRPPLRWDWTRFHNQEWIQNRHTKVWGKCQKCKDYKKRSARLVALQEIEGKEELDEKQVREKKELERKITETLHHFKAKENAKCFDDDLEKVKQDTSYMLMVVDFSRLSVGGSKGSDVNDSIAVLLFGDGMGGFSRKYVDTLPHREDKNSNNDFFFWRKWQYDISERVIRPMGKTKVIQWSDGGRKHYKQRFSLAEASLMRIKHPWLQHFEWNFWPSNHGKSLCDSHAGKIAQMVAYMAFHEDWIWESARDLGWLIKNKLSNSDPLFFQQPIDRDEKYRHKVNGIPQLWKYHYFEATLTPGLLNMKTFRNQPPIAFRFTVDSTGMTPNQVLLNTVGGRSLNWWPPELGLPPQAPRPMLPSVRGRRGRVRQERPRRRR